MIDLTLARIRLLAALGAALGSVGYVLCAMFARDAAVEAGVGYIVVVLSAAIVVRALR